jgi:hypothetical protein
MPAPCFGGRPWHLRRVAAVRPGWNPSAVRQPVLAPRNLIAVRHLAVQAAVRYAAVRLTAIGWAAIRRRGKGRAEARAEIRGEMAWRADGLLCSFAW